MLERQENSVDWEMSWTKIFYFVFQVCQPQKVEREPYSGPVWTPDGIITVGKAKEEAKKEETKEKKEAAKAGVCRWVCLERLLRWLDLAPVWSMFCNRQCRFPVCWRMWR